MCNDLSSVSALIEKNGFIRHKDLEHDGSTLFFKKNNRICLKMYPPIELEEWVVTISALLIRGRDVPGEADTDGYVCGVARHVEARIAVEKALAAFKDHISSISTDLNRLANI